MSDSENDFESEVQTDQGDSDSELDDNEDEPMSDHEPPPEGDHDLGIGDSASAMGSEVQFSFHRNQPLINGEEEAAQFISENPYLGKVFKKMIKDGIAEETKSNKTNPKGRQGNNQNGNIWEKTDEESVPVTTPIKRIQKTTSPFKSPSDTMIYAPMLNRVAESERNENELIDKISNFVEGIRLQTSRRRDSDQSTPRSSSHRNRVEHRPDQDRDRSPQAGTSREDPHGVRKEIREAEQFKPSAEPPRGMMFNNNDDNDDDFFHLTCHVDNNLKNRIERGEFIKLEKLLPKRKNFKGGNDDSRLEWITRDGMTFLAPVQDQEQKINGIKHWDQAFRVYAALYCGANPECSKEVWQYIYTIHSATSSYQWDNVAYYDYTFRQLMSERPKRSWAKTYAQLWQLALRDPISKASDVSTGSSGSHSNQKSKIKDWRDRCCWRFNRTGKCDKQPCNFDWRCSYCGIWNSHGANTCRKKGNAGKSNSPASREGGSNKN